MNQDPGDNDTIQSFCLSNYGVSFPVLGKTDVNGEKAEPVWEWMKAQVPGLLGFKRIKWNFEKFLVGRDGVCFSCFCVLLFDARCVVADMCLGVSKLRGGGRALRSRRAWKDPYWRR